MENKTLYFEGAGMFGCRSTSEELRGNCRIRTAFHLDDGRAVYLEITAVDFCGNPQKRPEWISWPVAALVDLFFEITGGHDDENNHAILHRNHVSFEYTPQGILKFLRNYGASFDAVEVLPDLAGYRVFGDYEKGVMQYHFGDEFVPDSEKIAAREYVKKGIEERDRAAGIEYPCFSLWADETEPNALHYINFRTKEPEMVLYIGYPKSHADLPILSKGNAFVGCAYSVAGGLQYVRRIYRLTDEYARENDLFYLDRVETSFGDFALL